MPISDSCVVWNLQQRKTPKACNPVSGSRISQCEIKKGPQALKVIFTVSRCIIQRESKIHEITRQKQKRVTDHNNDQ